MTSDDTRRPRGVWRAVLSAICIALASIVLPVSIMGGWARGQLVDETTFVDTFAPLAHDPRVQAALIHGTTSAIEARLDLAGLTDQAFDGIAGLGLPPRAAKALDALRQPAVEGMQALVEQRVTALVQSDAFATVWRDALRASHRALVATASGGTARGTVSVSDSGEVGIALGPIVAAVKKQLLDGGIGLAAAIPAVDTTVVIAQSRALVTVRIVYGLAVTVGWWLPLASLALFAAGILLARRRHVALTGSGLGVAVGGAALAVLVGVGGIALSGAAARAGIAAGASDAVYDRIVDGMVRTAVVAAVTGAILAVLAWTQGRSRAAGSLRVVVASVNADLRRSLVRRGLDTGAFGRWMYARRGLVRGILVALLVAWLSLRRPLGAGDVVLVLLVGLIAWWLAELAQRRPAPDA